jgi:hypothetical protein
MRVKDKLQEDNTLAMDQRPRMRTCMVWPPIVHAPNTVLLTAKQLAGREEASYAIASKGFDKSKLQV